MKSTYKGKVSQAITNLKAGNNSVECKREKVFLGHRDGIWEIKCSDYANNAILGTASAGNHNFFQSAYQRYVLSLQ